MMNLTIDPWIPALRPDGRRELFSLLDLFARAHELRDLAAKPHERVALMRLLICITQAALDGPADEDAWQECGPLIQPRVRDYLIRWRAAFELFGDGARFLQLPNLKPGKESDEGNAASKLDLVLATGNNSTLFDNNAGTGRSVEAVRIALNLLAFQCFSPGGRIGVAKWNGKETVGKGSSNHSPCTPSSMLHTFLLGESLLESVHRNLLTKENVSDFYGFNRWGQPQWELPVGRMEDKSAIENATRTYVGRLVPLSRAVGLANGGSSITIANGLDYPIYPVFREASATVIKRKDELVILPTSTNRSLWRQLGAVSVLNRAKGDAASGPIALNHLATKDVTVWVGALVTDKAKIEDAVEGSYRLPARMFTESGRVAYENGVGYADDQERSLSQAVKSYASALKVASPAYDRARQHFWTRVEQHLSALFDLARDTNQAADLPNCPWGRSARSAALDAYAQSCPRQTPRQIEAFALGLRRLNYSSPKPSTPVAHE